MEWVSYPFVYSLPIARLCIPLNRVGQITRYLVDFNRLPFYT
uniref:Uncharacterized protein n=2 Tax=unclassified Caudoviricetes TaxID=2788787 RepID=A0A8S5UN45_9CAUD|nr:MAG TPA: hypothetical protein [Siphoviridae sp. ctsus30]DAF95844.1 MAG TPA: hypothetical protein [Siphoviridae sp. ctKGQ3]